MPITDFKNSTHLQSDHILAMCADCMVGWRTGNVILRVRYSRGADFSGTCIYDDRKILINLGRNLRFPYMMGTHIAKAKYASRRWYKPVYTVALKDEYDLVLFVFLHEMYHLLVKRAGRNTRQKESMCDRFAARFLVDNCGAVVLDHEGQPADRNVWDFQDLDGFVDSARDRRVKQKAATRPQPASPTEIGDQLMLFQI